MRKLQQRHTTTELGDCFATCVAMVLDLPQDSVPNFCAGHAGGDWWLVFQGWMAERGLTAINITVSDGVTVSAGLKIRWVAEGTPCIFTGQSPRGDWLHSVVAVATGRGCGYELLHDPHPDGTFLDDVREIMFFAALRPDRVAKQP